MMRKYWYLFLKHQDYMLGLWVCKAMQWRGFSSHPIHPKHLFDVQRSEFLHGLFQPRIRFLDLGAGVGTDCLLAADKGAIFSVGLEGNWRSIQTGWNAQRKRRVRLNSCRLIWSRDCCLSLMRALTLLIFLMCWSISIIEPGYCRS